MEKLLEDAGIKLSVVASDIFGVSAGRSALPTTTTRTTVWSRDWGGWSASATGSNRGWPRHRCLIAISCRVR